MKKYEIIFVLQADEPEVELEARVAKVQAFAEQHGGAITERNHWGVRQLAYQIQHETRGNYMHLRFRCGGDAIAPMDTEFRLDHKILRHLIVVDEEWKERNEVSMAEKRRIASAATSRSPRFAAVEAAEPEPVDD
ncbi:MAG: 30S ribosomal protein S6 [bacterium]|nr:30S ribosomal protein S6 [bacterium]MBK9302695.1 30S ribosomal protein S6 [bacterium]